MTTIVKFVQISDCHLFADKTALHYGANVFENLCNVLKDIQHLNGVEFIVFTGDLTQDHTSQSYLRFVEAIELTQTTVPIYYIAGNHDEVSRFEQYFIGEPFKAEKTITSGNWQIQLLHSKTDTPAGMISNCEMVRIATLAEETKYQLLMMHHHPVDVGYFIDRHGLENAESFCFWALSRSNVKGVACGHIHNAIDLNIKDTGNSIPVYCCPATSIQFDIRIDTVANSGKPPGYRVFELTEDGEIQSQAVFINYY